MLEHLVNRDFCELLVAQVFLLTILGTAIIFPLRAGYVNLGVSAQLIAGAIVAAYSSQVFPALPSVFVAFCAITIVGQMPVWLRCRYGVSEVLTTLFLTFAIVPLSKLFLRLTTSTIALASPPIVDELFRRAMTINKFLTWFHLLALLIIPIAWLILERTALGYRLTVLRANARVFAERDGMRILTLLNVSSSALIALAVMADGYVYKGRYVAGEYDALGFIALAVSLIALGKPLRVLPAAILIASSDALFLILSVLYGTPQMGTYLVYGASILIAAYVLRQREEGYA